MRKAAKRATAAPAVYTVKFERDEGARWHVFVPAVSGCRTRARSISQGLDRIREALSLFVNDAETATLEPDIELPREVRQLLTRAMIARETLAKAEIAAAEATRAAAVAITSSEGIGVRDAAQLLGLSHQRIAQLATEAKAVRVGRTVTSEKKPRARMHAERNVSP